MIERVEWDDHATHTHVFAMRTIVDGQKLEVTFKMAQEQFIHYPPDIVKYMVEDAWRRLESEMAKQLFKYYQLSGKPSGIELDAIKYNYAPMKISNEELLFAKETAEILKKLLTPVITSEQTKEILEPPWDYKEHAASEFDVEPVENPLWKSNDEGFI